MERNAGEASGLGTNIVWANGLLSLQDPKREERLQAGSGLQVAGEVACLFTTG